MTTRQIFGIKCDFQNCSTRRGCLREQPRVVVWTGAVTSGNQTSIGSLSSHTFEQLRGRDNRDSEGFAQRKKIAVGGYDVFRLSGQSAGEKGIIGGVATPLLSEWRRQTMKGLVVNPVQEWQRRAIRKTRLLELQAGGAVLFFDFGRDTGSDLAARDKRPGAPGRAALGVR